jgi:hypothetical protein
MVLSVKSGKVFGKDLSIALELETRKRQAADK